MKISILGSGSWGLALAQVLASNGYYINVWCNDSKQINEINKFHTNNNFLKNVILSNKIFAYLNLNNCIKNSNIIIFALPVKFIRSIAKKVNINFLNKPIFVNVSKGLEDISCKRVSEILSEEIKNLNINDIVMISGPSHAEEVAIKKNTCVVVSSKKIENSIFIQKIFMNNYFKVYINNDIIGVEIASSLKNVIAICVGILKGMNYGDNIIAAIITIGLKEIRNIGLFLGAKKDTFFGLSGIGDIIVTCMSKYSRNYKAGYLLSKGYKIKEIFKKINMSIEGLNTIKAAYLLIKKFKINSKIISSIYKILYENKNINYIIKNEMLKCNKKENEF